MKQGARSRRIVYAKDALREMDGIIQWNENAYSKAHAQDYIDFVKRNIALLAENPSLGKQLAARPELRYLNVRKGTRGHGHVVVYEASDATIVIAHVFHSAQDWQSNLLSEE